MIVTKEELARRQNLSLNEKIEMSQCKIEEWWKHWDEKVYVSFSGGKDSTVLLHLVRNIFPDVLAVFSDTGLEYPEVKDFVKQTKNIRIVRPKLSYRQVVDKYGYPVSTKRNARFIHDVRHASDRNVRTVYLCLNGKTLEGKNKPSCKISKRWLCLLDAPFEVSDKCCTVLKKNPMRELTLKEGMMPYVGNLATDSSRRYFNYLKYGCSIFDGVQPISNPLGFWTEQDILQYLIKYDLSIPSVYGDIIENNKGKLQVTGVQFTGCVWCMFGAHLDKKPNRFQMLKVSHPKIYEYALNDMGLKEVLDYVKIPYK